MVKTKTVEKKKPLRCFSRVQIDDIDIIRRTVVCNEIPSITPTTSYTTECYEELSIEEEALPYPSEPTSEATRAQRLYDELECLKRRIQMMQLAIKRQRGNIESRDTTAMATEKEEEEEDDGDAFCASLDGSDNKFIDALQKAQHKMQCQLNEQILSMREIRKLLREKRRKSCQIVKMMRKLELSIDDFTAWKRLVDQEAAVCDERYEYILHVKETKKKAEHIISQRYRCILARKRQHLQRCTYQWNKAELIAELSNVLQFAEELRAGINHRFEKVQEIMARVYLSDMEDDDESSDFETSLFYSNGRQFIETIISSSSEESNTTMASDAYDLVKTKRKLKILKTVEMH